MQRFSFAFAYNQALHCKKRWKYLSFISAVLVPKMSPFQSRIQTNRTQKVLHEKNRFFFFPNKKIFDSVTCGEFGTRTRMIKTKSNNNNSLHLDWHLRIWTDICTSGPTFGYKVTLDFGFSLCLITCLVWSEKKLSQIKPGKKRFEQSLFKSNRQNRQIISQIKLLFKSNHFKFNYQCSTIILKRLLNLGLVRNSFHSLVFFWSDFI